MDDAKKGSIDDDKHVLITYTFCRVSKNNTNNVLLQKQNAVYYRLRWLMEIIIV